METKFLAINSKESEALVNTLKAMGSRVVATIYRSKVEAPSEPSIKTSTWVVEATAAVTVTAIKLTTSRGSRTSRKYCNSNFYLLLLDLSIPFAILRKLIYFISSRSHKPKRQTSLQQQSSGASGGGGNSNQGVRPGTAPKRPHSPSTFGLSGTKQNINSPYHIGGH